jgi:hypothetical protein
MMVEDFLRWRLWFPVGWVLIAAVSIYDILVSLRYREELAMLEENPLGIWLIQLGDGDVGVFMRFKAAGTLLVLLTLFRMMSRDSRLLMPVTGALASFQSVLLFYLTMG